MKESRTSVADIILVRGVLQILIFGMLVIRLKYKQKSQLNLSGQKENLEVFFIPNNFYNFLGCLIMAVMGCLPGLTVFAAVIYAPVADVTAVTSATPITSYLLSVIALKHRLSLLKILFCLLVIVGISLVVQPPILFGTSVDCSGNVTGNSTVDCQGAPTKFTSDFWIGMGYCMLFLFSGML